MSQDRKNQRRVVAVILDGLRRDCVTPELTPNLTAFRQRATWFSGYRSVFPSVTRVVSSSFATGCMPARHGLVGNTVALYDGDDLNLYDVGLPDFVDHKLRLTGHVLREPTLAEYLADHGGAIIYNNVSPGAAYMHDPGGHGYVYHRAGSFAPGRKPIQGDDALHVTGDMAGDRKATERFIADVVETRRPAFGLLWLGDPDKTQHGAPLGSAEHRAALAAVDTNVAMVAAAVDSARQAGDDILLLVGSDHGHETVSDVVDIAAELVVAGLKDDIGSRDVVVAPNGTAAHIYVDRRYATRISEIGRFLETRPWVGRAFGPDQLKEAGLPNGGGLSFAIALASDDGSNENGVPGRSFAAKPAGDKPGRLGRGQHGGLGRFEQSPVLMLNGGGFQSGRSIDAPSSVIDVAPTVLRFLGHPCDHMDGQPLQRL